MMSWQRYSDADSPDRARMSTLSYQARAADVTGGGLVSSTSPVTRHASSCVPGTNSHSESYWGCWSWTMSDQHTVNSARAWYGQVLIRARVRRAACAIPLPTTS